MFTVAAVPSALKQGIHDKLIADLDKFAEEAGVMPKWIEQPLAGGPAECDLQWLKRYKFHTGEGKSGYLITGNHLDVTDRFAAIAGALVRNWINARVMPLNSVLELLEDGDEPVASCLLIPNFFMGVSLEGQAAPWKIVRMLDLLISRRLEGKQTVLYVQHEGQMAAKYGVAFKEHFEKHFIKATN
jgi:hypothetical protein